MVGLGFSVDEGSLAKFNKSLTVATVKVTALYAATSAMAAGIVKSISSISGEFEQLGYEYRIIAPAINKALVLRQEMLKAYSLAGVNIVKVIQNSVKLNFSLDKTKFALKALYQSVGAKFFPLLTQQSDLFRNTIYKNMPKIQAALERFINFIFKAFQIMTELGNRLWSILTRVFDFFVMLDKATDGWSTVILSVIAAWKLLNLSFLATPLGMLIAGFVALLALWDDFKVWKEGGKSLINWGNTMTRTLVELGVAIGVIAAVLGPLNYGMKILDTTMKGVQLATKAWAAAQWLVNVAMNANPIGIIIIAIIGLISLITALDSKFGLLGGHLSGFFNGIGSKVMGFFGGNTGANIANNPVGNQVANPVGSNAQNSLTNQHVNQQTSINVIGSADANQTGKAVASQQGRVNRDLIDNMKGSTR